MSIFIIEHLSKTFRVNNSDNVVLNDISYKFPDSGLVSIVGKSGSGKSTLLNILMGIEKPSSGKVLINNKNIVKLKDNEFSKYHLYDTSLIFQHYNLFENLTAFDNVLTPLIMKGETRRNAKEKIENLFKRFNVDYLLHRKVNKLSGGEKQRVAIIRALAINPKAILCDEPTGALDSQNANEIMGILKKISERTLVIMVSHNLTLVNKYSDVILSLKNGKLEELINNSKQRLTNKFEPGTKRYKNSWTSLFLKQNLKKNFSKNFVAFLGCSISFSAMFLSIGFSEGSKASQVEAFADNLGLTYSTCSETEFVEIKDSPLLFQKTTRPTLEEIDSIFSSFSSIRCEENLTYFISSIATCRYETTLLDSFEMIPIYDLDNDFDEIIVNDKFLELIGNEDLLGSEIVLSNEAVVNYPTGDKANPFIKDNFSYSKKFKVASVVKEFPFLNTPKIYYSYKGAKKFLKEQMMENLSFYLKDQISYFEYLASCKNDDPICGYSYLLFIENSEEIPMFLNKINELKQDESLLQVNSPVYEIQQTYQTFISSFSSALKIFMILAFLGINFTLGMISLSTFLENKKETAIMTCLGASNKSIKNLYLVENLLIVFFSFFMSIFLALGLENTINKHIFNKYYLNKLIRIPFSFYFNIPFGLIISLFIVASIFSTIFTVTPMFVYRKISLAEELRDE